MKAATYYLRKALPFGIGALSLAASITNAATAGTSAGTISEIDTVGSLGGAPGNADTRVYMNGITSFCAGVTDGSWAFINANDANYKGVLATLMLAYSTGKSVIIYTQSATVGGGTFCQITMVKVLG